MNSHQRALQVVREVGDINLVGNIIPHAWFLHLKRPNGQPYLLAIILLGEVVYWYRPIILKDESTGQALPARKKFSGHKFRTTYGDLARRFGVSRDQAREAITFLVNQEVLTREIKDNVRIGGVPTGNVLFLEPIPAGLRRINALPTDEPAETPSGSGDHEGEEEISAQPPLFGYGPYGDGADADEAAELSDPSGSGDHKGGGESSTGGSPPLGSLHPEGHSLETLTLMESTPRSSEPEDPDPHGLGTLSLKGTKTPSEIPPQTSSKTPPLSAALAVVDAAAREASIAALRQEGIMAVDEFADLPADLIRAAALDTGLPVGHEARPGFTVRRLRAYREGKWLPPGDRAPAPAPASPPPSVAPTPQAGVWAAVLDQLRSTMPKLQFDTWLSDTQLLDLADTSAIVGCPHVFAREKVERDYREQIEAALQRDLGHAVSVQFVIGAIT